MHQSKLSADSHKFFDQIEFDENEELVGEIRKHPVGLVIIYLTGLLVGGTIFLLIAFASVALRNDTFGTGSDGGSLPALMSVIGMVIAVVTAIATAIGAYLYRGNVVLVTSEKIAQRLYINLFNRKISQLSIGDVQDVTVTKKGILAHMFNYGTIVIETAGEQQNYTFTYTPNPYEIAKDIVGAHERNLVRYGN